MDSHWNMPVWPLLNHTLLRQAKLRSGLGSTEHIKLLTLGRKERTGREREKERGEGRREREVGQPLTIVIHKETILEI